MKPLSLKNIESELSYAYLHAIASHAGAGCVVAGRHDDNAGVDATITAWGPFPDGGYRTEVDLKVQLKATIKQPIEVNGCFAYSLGGIARYDDLRSDALSTPRILIVLFLPDDPDQWISHSDDALSLHRCAYWVSLRGAKPSDNKTAQTIYIPKTQRFDVLGLRSLFSSISKSEIPKYTEIEA